MKNNILYIAVPTLAAFILTACGSTGAIVVRGVVTGAKIVRGVTGSERDTLCDYYTAHRAEVEAVRAYAKANWNEVPEDYKPALVAINERLIACDNPQQMADGKSSTGAALLEALKRAVALYGKLNAAGVI